MKSNHVPQPRLHANPTRDHTTPALTLQVLIGAAKTQAIDIKGSYLINNIQEKKGLPIRSVKIPAQNLQEYKPKQIYRG